MGERRGVKKNKEEIARRLLIEEMSIEKIAKHTRLTEERFCN
jgi:hypothetical protein